MSSLCIKTNNDEILKYLQNEFKDFNMLNVSFSSNEFKNYRNVIIHYKGTDFELFYTKLATILSYLVIEYFENSIIKTILISNYFYFDNYEIEDIDQIPLITHASNFFILKKVMESCLINYIDVNRIYNPEKEVELYPEAKYYPDITGKHVDKPINIIRRKIKQIEKAYNY